MTDINKNEDIVLLYLRVQHNVLREYFFDLITLEIQNFTGGACPRTPLYSSRR